MKKDSKSKSELKNKHTFSLKRRSSWTVTAEKKEKQGYSVEVYPAMPKGWIVTSHLHLDIGGN